MIARSAAYRIAFAYAAAFASAILLLGIAVYFAADHDFRRQRDRAIVEEATRVASLGDLPEITRAVNLRSGVRSHDAFLYALFDATGRRIAGRLDAPAPALGMRDIVFNAPGEPEDVARADTRALASGYRLTVGVDSELIERIDATILALFGGAFVVVLALGVAAALVFGGYLRRRLGAVSATAGAIVAGELDRRVPVSARGDEFDAVGAAINAMLDRIAQLMDSLRQVSSDVAHDLRTPLVRLRAQLALIGHEPGATARATEQVDALLSLFAAILRIAEVERGAALARRRLDLSLLAAEIAETYQPALADSGRTLDWRVELGIVIDGDRELLAQALVNLLDNARVHTSPATHVRVSVRRAGAQALLCVTDNGPGVGATEHARILDRFARGEASRTTPGHGLGLSLVRAIAAAHGGQVLVEDAAPGLRITLVLPGAAA